MTELQTILKERLARGEANTQSRFNENERQITNLKTQVRQLQAQLDAQAQQQEHWQRLEALCGQLEPLLRQWSGMRGKLPHK